MNILDAEQAIGPSPSGTARVRTAARSEPACGSVRFIVPVHSPATSGSQKARLSSSDATAVASASMAPVVSIWPQREGHVGGLPHLGHGAERPASASPARRCRGCWHRRASRLRRRRNASGKPIGGGDLAVGPAAALAVAGRVQRRQYVRCETAGLGPGRPRQVSGAASSTPGQGGDLRQAGQMVEHEAHVVQGGCIGHDALSFAVVTASRAFLATSRSMNFWILPVEVFGIGPNTTAFGTL